MDNQEVNDKLNTNENIDNTQEKDISTKNMDNIQERDISTENDIDSDTIDDSIEEDDSDVFTYTVDNNNVSNDYNNFKYDDKRSFVYIIIGVAVLVSIIALIVFFVNKEDSKNTGFSDIETKMVNSAKDYYAKNENLLPTMDGGVVTVDSDTLIQNSYLKPFSEMVDDNISCTGTVSVSKNGDDYVYFPSLDCGSDYSTVRLSEKIIESSVVTSGDGLYQVNDEYIFRGEYPNNFVSFDKKQWRIVKINNDNTIKMILLGEKLEKSVWDDRYNSLNDSYSGINDFRVSRALEYLTKAYDENIFVSKKNKKFLVKNSWCIGKLSEEDVSISGLNLCNDVYQDLYIGTLQADDVLNASIDKKCINVYDGECTNYNYFATIPSTWTLNASSDKSFNVFYTSGGSVSYKKASNSNYIRPVINVNANVLYKSGDGTEEKPYILGE